MCFVGVPKRGPCRATLPDPVRPLVVLLLLACATPIIYRRVVPAPEPVTKRLEPVLPRRDACLQPPWWAADGGRETFFVGAGPRASYLETAELQRDALDAWVATGAFAGGGVYLSEDGGGIQGIHVKLCAIPRDALVALLESQARDTGRSYEVALELRGAVGPRCEADDPACTPAPYLSGRVAYRPDRPRVLIYPFARDAGAECRWDGECRGGQQCRPWNADVFAETLELRVAQENAFCGCVEQRCQWFDQ